MNDWLLALWLILEFAFTAAMLAGTAYLVFWRGHSGWWFLLAIECTVAPTLYRVLAKRFGVTK